METGYIPLEEDKKKLNSPQQIPPLGEPRIHSKSVLLVYSNRYIPLCETRKILQRATPYNKVDTTEYSVSTLRFGRMHNSSQSSFDTLKNLCGAQDVRNTGICVVPKMPLKSNLQLEVFDIWGVHFMILSLCQSNVSTSWWPWTICPNG